MDSPLGVALMMLNPYSLGRLTPFSVKRASEPVVLSLLRSKCEPLVLYVVEACLLLARQTLSFEFTLTRIFMKLFRTGSSKVVNECQVSFGFLPAKSRILIRTASFFAEVYCVCMPVHAVCE